MKRREQLHNMYVCCSHSCSLSGALLQYDGALLQHSWGTNGTICILQMCSPTELLNATVCCAVLVSAACGQVDKEVAKCLELMAELETAVATKKQHRCVAAVVEPPAYLPEASESLSVCACAHGCPVRSSSSLLL